MLLDGRVLVVSGVGPGLGRAIASAAAREGADVVLLSRTAAAAELVAREVEAHGRRALHVETDVTDPAACQNARDRTLERFGRVDVLVNNAFTTGPFEPIASAKVVESWRAPFKVNVFGSLQISQAFAEPMKSAGRGSIVMIGSMAARKLARDLAAYGASKAALLFAARALATELGPHGVRVNTVVPGHIDGPSLDFYFKMEAQRRSVSEEQARNDVTDEGALKRIATPEEVADTVLFFASDLSAAVTGQALDVNCGQWFE
jgi:NAD(P)-dependent dehydrogenase (short-subunit alcohol dehydrogenase family)